MISIILALSLQHIPPPPPPAPAEPPPRELGLCIYSAHEWHKTCIVNAMSDFGECVDRGAGFVNCRTAFNFDIGICSAERISMLLDCEAEHR